MEDRPVLAQVVASVTPLASEVVVATSSGPRRKELARHLPTSVRFLLDRPERWGAGPAGAMASAREEFGRGPVLFVPGDIPWAETRALRRFVARAEGSSADVATPHWESGETEHLVQYHRSPATVRTLPWRRTRSLPFRRASEFLRASPRTLLVSISTLTDRPESFSHVTYPTDAQRPALRGRAGPPRTDREIEGAPKRWYGMAQAAWSAGSLREAARAFAKESRWYEGAGLGLLAWHSLLDASHAAGADPEVLSACARLERRFPRSRAAPETVNRAG